LAVWDGIARGWWRKWWRQTALHWWDVEEEMTAERWRMKLVWKAKTRRLEDDFMKGEQAEWGEAWKIIERSGGS
jgi:hypothetical protein